MTYRRQILRATSAFPVAVATILVLGWFTYSLAQQTTARWDVSTDAEVMQIRDHAEGSPAALLAVHGSDCWTGTQTPKAALPGSALVQDRSGVTVRTHRPAVVDSAFREALAAAGVAPAYDDPNITVVALCLPKK